MPVVPLLAVPIVIAGIRAYATSFTGVFVLDDIRANRQLASRLEYRSAAYVSTAC